MMTWNLVSQSFRLLRSDKKLLVFPILNAIGAAALAILFLLALFGMRPAGGLGRAASRVHPFVVAGLGNGRADRARWKRAPDGPGA
jgi:hypothetical protein